MAELGGVGERVRRAAELGVGEAAALVVLRRGIRGSGAVTGEFPVEEDG